MKKIHAFLFFIFSAFICINMCDKPVWAQEADKILNLHTDGAYIMNLPERPIELNVSNEKVIRVEVFTNLYSPESQIVIRSFVEGISYITYKAGAKKYTLKVLVDNRSVINQELTEIDKVKEP